MSIETITTSGIVYIWQYDNIFFYSNVYNKTSGIPFNFPTSICNIDDKLIVCFMSDLTMSNINNYFICMSNNITFDGNNTNYIVTISEIENYNGLIKSNGYSNIIVKNITMKSINNSSLLNGSGWICQSNFGSNATLLFDNNESGSNATLLFDNNGSGSNTTLLFDGPNKKSTGCEIINCSSDGEISNYSGGIVGSCKCKSIR